MTSFSDQAFEKKLSELNNSQQSIQTLSLWLIHHRKHNRIIVKVWYRELIKAKPARKLTFMYLANDVIQNSRKKGPEFPKEFATVLVKAFHHIREHSSDEKTKKGLNRIVEIWNERAIYDGKLTEVFKKTLAGAGKNPGQKEEKVKPEKVKEVKSSSNSERKSRKEKELLKEESGYTPTEIVPVSVKKSKYKEAEPIESPLPIGLTAADQEESLEKPGSPPSEPPESGVLIKALQDLEHSASCDAGVRQKIASLPPEVSDSSLLEKIRNKREADALSEQVEEASDLLNDYNGRLQAELEERKLVATMLHDYIKAQREQLAQSEARLEEFKLKLHKVTQVRNELRSHLQNLPDLTRLPDVTGGLAPLPSAGDLFNLS